MSEFPFTLELSLKTCEHLIFHQNQFNLTNLIITFKTANALSQDLQQNVALSLPVDDAGLEETGELEADLVILQGLGEGEEAGWRVCEYFHRAGPQPSGPT